MNYKYSIDSLADVYAIGRTMHSLIDLKSSGEAGYDNPNFDTKERDLPQINETEYSIPLLHLVRQCSALWPEERISIEELWDELRDAIEDEEEQWEYCEHEEWQTLRIKNDDRYVRFARS